MAQQVDGNKEDATSGTATVAVRVRPFIKEEYARLGGQAPTLCCAAPSIQSLDITGFGKTQRFSFDRVYWSHNPDHPHFATQATLYEEIGKSMLRHLLAGYNTCIFAYGQTGSGKSYSVLGQDTAEGRGLLPRVVQGLFEEFEGASSGSQCECVVSFLEIYNEQIRDLLAPLDGSAPGSGNQPDAAARGRELTPNGGRATMRIASPSPGRASSADLKIQQLPGQGVVVLGLTEQAVTSKDETLRLIDFGTSHRTVGATAMNNGSSRSHCIFTFKTSVTGPDGVARRSQTHLVDLAGSERAGRTQAQGDRLKEGAAINQSLTTLATVIRTLAENCERQGKRAAAVPPFRDSKLTYILKESLCGNSKTIMMAAISPSLEDYEETMSTLRFAQTLKKVQLSAVANEQNMAEEAAKQELAKARAAANAALQKAVRSKNPEELKAAMELAQAQGDSIDQATLKRAEALLKEEENRVAAVAKLEAAMAERGLAELKLAIKQARDVNADGAQIRKAETILREEEAKERRARETIFEATPKLDIGTRVTIAGRAGTVRFHGTTKFQVGVWVGVELDTPVGKNDGTVQGVSYFVSKPDHGVFVRPNMVQVLPDQDEPRRSVVPAASPRPGSQAAVGGGGGGEPDAAPARSDGGASQNGGAGSRRPSSANGATDGGGGALEAPGPPPLLGRTASPPGEAQAPTIAVSIKLPSPAEPAGALVKEVATAAKAGTSAKPPSSPRGAATAKAAAGGAAVKPPPSPRGGAPKGIALAPPAPLVEERPQPQASPRAFVVDPPPALVHEIGELQAQVTQLRVLLTTHGEQALAAKRRLADAEAAAAAAAKSPPPPAGGPAASGLPGESSQQPSASQLEEQLQALQASTRRLHASIEGARGDVSALQELRNTLRQKCQQAERARAPAILITSAEGQDIVRELQAEQLARGRAERELQDAQLELTDIELKVEEATDERARRVCKSGATPGKAAEYQEALRVLYHASTKEVSELQRRVSELDRSLANEATLREDAEKLMQEEERLQEHLAELQAQAHELQELTQTGAKLQDARADVEAELQQDLERCDERVQRLEDLVRRLHNEWHEAEASIQQDSRLEEELLKQLCEDGTTGAGAESAVARHARGAAKTIRNRLARIAAEMGEVSASAFAGCLPAGWVPEKCEAAKDPSRLAALHPSTGDLKPARLPPACDDCRSSVRGNFDAVFGAQRQLDDLASQRRGRLDALRAAEQRLEQASRRHAELQKGIGAVLARRAKCAELTAEAERLRGEVKQAAASHAALMQDLAGARAKREEEDRRGREIAAKLVELEAALDGMRRRPQEQDGRATTQELATLFRDRAKGARELFALQVARMDRLAPLPLADGRTDYAARSLTSCTSQYSDLRTELLGEWVSTRLTLLPAGPALFEPMASTQETIGRIQQLQVKVAQLRRAVAPLQPPASAAAAPAAARAAAAAPPAVRARVEVLYPEWVGVQKAHAQVAASFREVRGIHSAVLMDGDPAGG